MFCFVCMCYGLNKYKTISILITDDLFAIIYFKPAKFKFYKYFLFIKYNNLLIIVGKFLTNHLVELANDFFYYYFELFDFNVIGLFESSVSSF